ncbi:MAG: preprotein translocase subunit YajC [Candidatus Latescibacterota bacterium]|nr:MAG: preprotein translocase subunit YajC [Candidatus Latescibacterota bacterium]
MCWEGIAWAAEEGRPAAGGGLGAFLPLILIFLVMYLLIIRPQQKRQKEHQRMLESLEKGDRVVTSGGIHGEIVGFKEREGTVVLKVADNVKIEISRSAIARKVER